MQVHLASYPATLRAAANGAWSVESPLQGYLRKIEDTMDRGSVGRAVRLAAALPHICSILEDPHRYGSPAHYMRWCEAWLNEGRVAEADEPLTGAFLFRLYSAGVIPRQLSCATREEFNQRVCRALIEAARRWYQQYGCHDLTVQQNLGRQT